MSYEYDVIYPIGSDDAMRVCSWIHDRWSKDGKRITRRVCGVKFQVWNRQANRDPFVYCPKHASNEWKQKERRGRRESAEQ